MIHIIKNQKGVSFLEMIIAVGIIGIAIITLYMVFVYGIKINQKAKYYATAYQIANQEMETVRNTTFANLSNQEEGDFLSDSSADLAKLKNGQGLLTIRDYEEDANIKEIIVIVRWNEDSTTRSVSLITLATLGGINQ